MNQLLKKVQIELSFWLGIFVEGLEIGFDLNVIKMMVENKPRIKKVIADAAAKGIDDKDEFDALMKVEFPELEW